MDRRAFLKNVGLAGATLLGPQIENTPTHTQPTPSADAAVRPNILIILVDQLRTAQWFPDQDALDQHLPGLARLRSGAVNFSQHYTAANACSPARSTLLTGLYTHQTGCLLTMTRPAILGLDKDFPTWGTMLRQQGYNTYWYGKWHLSPTPTSTYNLEPYGFSGGTYPSPNGLPLQGINKDASIAQQFITWMTEHGHEEPWCTTVSLVNPHDIAFYPRWTDISGKLRNPPSVFNELPPNFETSEQLIARHAPRLQLAHQELSAEMFGYLPFDGAGYAKNWLKLLDLYLLLTKYVDEQILRVLNALESDANLAARTIILFTSDHGEYGGSHGLRGKGDGVYDEAIRVPLYVKDPTGLFVKKPEIERTQLTSSVDIAPLLLTLTSGGTSWRQQAQYAHISRRLDLARLLLNPDAPGRPYVLHTADESVIEGPDAPVIPADIPRHVIGLRTTRGKIGTYSFWAPQSFHIRTASQESESYDYRSENGRMELNDAMAVEPALRRELYDQLFDEAIPHEVRAPLPEYLLEAQQRGQQAYLKTQVQDNRVFLPSILT